MSIPNLTIGKNLGYSLKGFKKFINSCGLGKRIDTTIIITSLFMLMIYLLMFDSYFIRFCINVRVMDNTDSANFVIFDKDASSLFDMSCADMVAAMETVCTKNLCI
jgi:hypothetical protein